MEYAKALAQAERFVNLLSPACQRIEIVGSVKRNDKPEVHDIEILLIPKNERPVPEFGKPNQIYRNVLEKLLDDLRYDEIIRHAADKKDGERYKKFVIVGASDDILNDFHLDLFIVTPVTWGLQNVIRTGPSLFSHRFVTNVGIGFWDDKTKKRYTGFLPKEFTYVRAKDSSDKLSHIKRGEEILSLPEEKDAIELLGFGWIPPNERSAWSIR
jgi:DNA polymerase/3'-5' exonuclease PolX